MRPKARWVPKHAIFDHIGWIKPDKPISSQAKESTQHATTIYCRLPTSYQLKMKASREVYSEIVKKAGAFPFPLRILENETRAKLA